MLPHCERSFPYSGRELLADQEALRGILHVAHAGIHRECLPRVGLSAWACLGPVTGHDDSSLKVFDYADARQHSDADAKAQLRKDGQFFLVGLGDVANYVEAAVISCIYRVLVQLQGYVHTSIWPSRSRISGLSFGTTIAVSVISTLWTIPLGRASRSAQNTPR